MKPAVKTTLRVGKIHYTNTLPFFHNLEKSAALDVRYYASYPAQVNLAMRRGRVDLAPISSLEYLNHHSQYYLLPGLGIGARDFSGSVLLFSRSKIESLNHQTIGLTRESLSSSILLRALLKFKFKFENRFKIFMMDPKKALQRYPAALVIGDQALMHRSEDFVYKYDLSEQWWNWTEKPFCFALWAVRREFADENPEAVSLFYRELKDNLAANLEDLETLIKEGLDIGFIHPQFAKIFGYLFNLSYQLDASMYEGLELFYRLSHRLNFSPRMKALEFFKETDGHS